MSEELLPCAHCGSKAQYGVCTDENSENWNGEFIECTNPECGMSTCVMFPSMESVRDPLAERWNARYSLSTPQTEERTDKERLDWLDANLVSISHARASHSVYMDGTTIQGQVLNDRSKGGGTFRKIRGTSIRSAIDSAITATEQGSISDDSDPLHESFSR